MRRTVSTRGGFSLVELLIASSLAALIAVSATMAGAQSYDAYRAATRSTTVEAKLRHAVQRVAQELLLTGTDVIFPPNIDDEFGTSDLVFQQAVGVVNGAIVWGPTKRLVLEYELGEVDDGVDNNGNGLVDECRLVLVRNDGVLGETRTVLCHSVREFLEGEEEDGDDDNANGITDEAGFNVHRAGDILTVRLTIEELGPQGPVTRTLGTSVLLRN